MVSVLPNICHESGASNWRERFSTNGKVSKFTDPITKSNDPSIKTACQCWKKCFCLNSSMILTLLFFVSTWLRKYLTKSRYIRQHCKIISLIIKTFMHVWEGIHMDAHIFHLVYRQNMHVGLQIPSGNSSAPRGLRSTSGNLLDQFI